ncbi:hypothetical protein KAS42_03910 [bacterium]|nr:hypothetical protein [bacterium]
MNNAKTPNGVCENPVQFFSLRKLRRSPNPDMHRDIGQSFKKEGFSNACPPIFVEGLPAKVLVAGGREIREGGEI